MKKKKGHIIFLLALTVILSVLGTHKVQAAVLPAPKTVTVKTYNKTGAAISWKAVAGAKGYRVYRRAAASKKWTAIRTVPKCQTVIDSGLKMGERYYYTVRAYKTVKGKTQWGSYNKTGISVIAGLPYLKLNRSSLSLQVGKSATLKINGTRLNPTWASKNTSVATVKNGKVVGKKAGTTTITAKLGGKTFSCKVKVSKANKVNSEKDAQKYLIAYLEKKYGKNNRPYIWFQNMQTVNGQKGYLYRCYYNVVDPSVIATVAWIVVLPDGRLYDWLLNKYL